MWAKYGHNAGSKTDICDETRLKASMLKIWRRKSYFIAQENPLKTTFVGVSH